MKIAIANQKGGSGKTTMAVLTAKAYAEQGHSVLLVDCDPQGGASHLLGCAKTPGLFDLLTQQNTLLECTHKSNTPGLWVVPADYRLDQIFATANPFALSKGIGDIEGHVIVYDTPPTVQGLTRAAILAADTVLVPCELSETALQPTLYAVSQIAELGKVAKVIVSGYKHPDELRGAKHDLALRYEKAFGKSLAGALPRTGSVAKLATERGKWTPKTMQTVQKPLIAWGAA